jgi:hypothetical protein
VATVQFDTAQEIDKKTGYDSLVCASKQMLMLFIAILNYVDINLEFTAFSHKSAVCVATSLY